MLHDEEIAKIKAAGNLDTPENLTRRYLCLLERLRERDNAILDAALEMGMEALDPDTWPVFEQIVIRIKAIRNRNFYSQE